MDIYINRGVMIMDCLSKAKI